MTTCGRSSGTRSGRWTAEGNAGGPRWECQHKPVTRMKSRIMYIECKAAGLSGPARIGRVTFSKTGKTLYYAGRTFQSLKGRGFKSNYYDVATGEEYWISGPRKDGADRLYGGRDAIEIDPDVRLEYWRDIRGLPERRNEDRA